MPEHAHEDPRPLLARQPRHLQQHATEEREQRNSLISRNCRTRPSNAQHAHAARLSAYGLPESRRRHPFPARHSPLDIELLERKVRLHKVACPAPARAHAHTHKQAYCIRESHEKDMLCIMPLDDATRE